MKWYVLKKNKQTKQNRQTKKKRTDLIYTHTTG